MDSELERILDSLYSEEAELPIESEPNSKNSNVTSWEVLETGSFDKLEFESPSNSSNFSIWEVVEVTFENLEAACHSRNRKDANCETMETEKYDGFKNERNSMTASNKTKFKTCSICEDEAYVNCYGAICCNSCKCFFRRSVVQNINFKCKFNGKCIINKETGRKCSYCRLQKCFKKGMKKELIKTSKTGKEICIVCGNSACGMVYGALTCEGCYHFFFRTITENLSNTYSCKFVGNCSLTKEKYIMCRYCRLQKCLKVGMRKDMVRKKCGSLATE